MAALNGMTNGSRAKANAPYVLYHYPMSICSLMVLYTVRLRGEPKSPEHAVDVVEQEVDIYVGEQMSEWYLEKNPKGQVPTLVADSLDLKIPDSSHITNFLSERYPSLVPTDHKPTIDALMDELHQISFVSLSFKPEDRRVEGITETVQEMLKRDDISHRHRELLNWKVDNHVQEFKNSHTNETIADHERRVEKYFSKVLHLMKTNNPPTILSSGDAETDGERIWIFGPRVGPTALDAHTVPLVARLHDAEREYLIPDEIKRYGRQCVASPEWQSFTGGRPTLHTVWEAMLRKRGELVDGH